MSAPHRRSFGNLPDEREVGAWTLRGAGGLTVEILEYGAAVSTLLVPDREGETAEVVLGFDDFEDWRTRNTGCFGVVVGRIAGRVPGARLRWEDREISLMANDGDNHLHGGPDGLSQQLWRGEAAGPASLELHYESPDGEGGYPGRVEIRVCYTVTPENALIFETEVRSDETTPVSLAQHSYFHLGGAGLDSAEDHEVAIFADTVMTTDEKMTPLGKAEPVAGQACDLREARRIGDVLPDLWQQHGDMYRLDGEGLRRVAHVVDPKSGRTLEVSTTQDFLQFYAAEHLDGSLAGKGGAHYPKHAGLAFECQGYPDPSAGFGDILVRPGEVQRHRTIYAFGTIYTNQ